MGGDQLEHRLYECEKLGIFHTHQLAINKHSCDPRARGSQESQNEFCSGSNKVSTNPRVIIDDICNSFSVGTSHGCTT
ncbi:hypothetical protein H5410_001277 [Solanum commersonii]|uniref:Uncharacterized protein n=1 Tax=Solanum commersonii TaxID=4109 RepID=A0A9J6AYJ9_SOLCO|nr:hypothetical protein H5410_001277 [Solanum commersonii]